MYVDFFCCSSVLLFFCSSADPFFVFSVVKMWMQWTTNQEVD